MKSPWGCLLLSILLAGCAGASPGALPQTSTLTLSLAGLFPGDRHLQVVPAGTQARVSVTGPGIPEPLSVTAPITPTTRLGTLRGIPAGPNRVITLEALDTHGTPLPGGRFLTTATLQPGANSTVISPATTPRGEVFTHLLAMNSPLAATLDADALQNALEAIQREQRLPHFALLNAQTIAQALSASDGDLSALSPSHPGFVEAPVSLRLTLKGLPSSLTAQIWLDDPVSATHVAAENGTLDLFPIKPGKWKLRARASSLSLGPIDLDLRASGSVTLDFATMRVGEPALPEPRGAAAAAVLTLDGKSQLVLAGGLTQPTPHEFPHATSTMLVFDGQTWHVRPEFMPLPASHAAVATRGNELWVIGGLDDLGQPLDRVQVFDATTKTWTTKTWTLPFPISHASAGFVGNDLILAAGARDGAVPVHAIYRISPDTGTAESFGDELGKRLVYPRAGAATAVIDGKLFVFSGMDGSFDLVHTAEVIDPQAKTAYAIAPIPTPRFGATTWVKGEIIYVIGGVSARGKALDTVEAYDLRRDRWELRPPLHHPRGYLAGGMLNGRFVAAGGHDGYVGVGFTSVLPVAVVESLVN